MKHGSTLPSNKSRSENLANADTDIHQSSYYLNGVKLFDTGNYIEAIEIFSIIMSESGSLLARQYLARCYYRLERYEAAYKHYEYLSRHGENNMKDYSLSMIATIEEMWGNIDKAIKIMRSLPSNTRNLINLAIMYWKKYKIVKEEFSIREAMKILNRIDVDKVSNGSIERINHLRALFCQVQKEYNLSETYFKRALELSDREEKGKILNDYASLLIEIGRVEEAEEFLMKARKLVYGNSEMGEAFNNKWLGILYIIQRKYYEAKIHLEKAAKVLREKELLQELAGIDFLLADLAKKEDFYKAAEYFADGVASERLSEEVKERDEKIIDFYFDSFFGRTDRNSPD